MIFLEELKRIEFVVFLEEEIKKEIHIYMIYLYILI